MHINYIVFFFPWWFWFCCGGSFSEVCDFHVSNILARSFRLHYKIDDFELLLYYFPSFRKCDVINRGFSGYTTRCNKLILPRLLSNDNNPEGGILAVTILLGSNDCEDASIENSRNVPINEYKENLKDICGQFKNVEVAFDRQVLITPPVLVEEAWTEYCTFKG